MNTIKPLIFAAIVGATIFGAAESVLAAEMLTPPVTIAAVATSWNEDSVLVSTVEPVVAHTCPTKDGYISLSTDPARKNIANASMAALLAGKKVQMVIVEGGTSCTHGRPRLVSISLQR